MWCDWHGGMILEELVVNTHLLVTWVQGVETETGKVITRYEVWLAWWRVLEELVVHTHLLITGVQGVKTATLQVRLTF